jgi:hypothetical protein
LLTSWHYSDSLLGYLAIAPGYQPEFFYTNRKKFVKKGELIAWVLTPLPMGEDLDVLEQVYALLHRDKLERRSIADWRMQDFMPYDNERAPDIFLRLDSPESEKIETYFDECFLQMQQPRDGSPQTAERRNGVQSN